MSFNEVAERVVSEGIIGVGFLVDPQGNQYWSVGEWPGFDPMAVIQAWQRGDNSVVVNDIKFSVINKGDDKYVATNIQQQGHIIVAKCMFWDGYVVAWSPANVLNTVAYAEVARMANAVRS